MLLPSALGFSPHPPVSVYGTGTDMHNSGFSRQHGSRSSLLIFRSASRSSPCTAGFPCHVLVPRLRAASHSAPALSLMRPHSSVIPQYRNLNLLSIDYAFRPRLRPRLTQSRSALLWKPWIFGLEGFPPPSRYSFRHSLFNTLHSSFRYCFLAHSMLLYQSFRIPQLRRRVSAPDIFGAGPLDQ